MNFTVFLGNLPTWVTADDIKAWLTAENLVADSVKVIRNHETQESKGFAFVEAPTADEMQAIIRRCDRAPLEDRLLRANPAQPSKGKETGKPAMERPLQQQMQQRNGGVRKPRRGKDAAPKTAFGAELAKAL
jgi:RNA recognition motif-containing protein